MLGEVAAISPASAREVARRLDAPGSKVRYHLRCLFSMGLVEVVEERTRRGMIERYYRSVREPVVEDEEFALLDDKAKLRIAAAVMTPLFADAMHAFRAETIQDDHHLTRVPLEVDRQGWSELQDIHRDAWERVEQVKRRAAARLGEGAEAGMPVTSAQLCFKVPRR